MSKDEFLKQIEKAGKVAKYALILGESELNNGEVSVKNLSTSEQKTVKLQEFLKETEEK